MDLSEQDLQDRPIINNKGKIIIATKGIRLLLIIAAFCFCSVMPDSFFYYLLGLYCLLDYGTDVLNYYREAKSGFWIGLGLDIGICGLTSAISNLFDEYNGTYGYFGWNEILLLGFWICYFSIKYIPWLNNKFKNIKSPAFVKNIKEWLNN